MISATELVVLESKTSSLLVDVGSFIMHHWQDDHKINYKNERDSATEIDVEAEAILRKELSLIFPEAGFIVEEGSSAEKTEYNWVIDPIDGTKQFVSQMPLFNTQLALLYQGKPILGLIYNPVSKQLFSATSGNGTMLNGIKIKPSFNRKINESIIDVDFGGTSDSLDARNKILHELFKTFYRVRMFAGIFGAYQLTGAFDGTISLSGKINVYDLAPHDIILQEAGIEVEYFKLKNIGEVRISGFPNTFMKLKSIIASEILI
jgi:myo-inositol-1(or 4)-monophosphatase